ncbi:beta-ketoacyl-[acyl-carrier-protein] synthase family protein [Pontibacillus marinus]|uniref:Ketosynthase family 3 (KS3) domain-containing protein n=1 Tax=Pontibacillus marinus BH030004 = DSM 16465 TaxID=1385511 RepID=A0A0A5I5Z6_9BACI|nr:beta-ketoacyl synthase N-terminal-like domain-containing protein [Pontibacillus marinus]KGX91252.1 hypothetical protein N783_10885 [Pontibacillus marinus BH030004 = DSM 16465]
MGRTVVTGMGIQAPQIQSTNDFEHVLEKGVCTHSILHDHGPNHSSIVAGQITQEPLNERAYKRYPRSSRLAMAAADEALRQADIKNINPSRIAVIMGTSLGSLLEIEQNCDAAKDFRKFPCHGVVLADSHTLSSSVAMYTGAKGHVHTITTGCASSSDAILMGKLLLDSNQADVCIVGGADASLGQWSTYGFAKLRSIAQNTDPRHTGVPFSNEHHGFVMSEGAGIITLEREDHANQRGAIIHGIVENVYSNNEALPMLKADETGESMLEALNGVLQNHQPSYVNSQALGLQTNDNVEKIVHHKLFGNSIPITSIKGMTGHIFGSMGVIQVISSLISFNKNFIPPTINTNGKGYEDLPIVYEPKYQPVTSVAITTHGNGGNNTCLLMKKYE